MDALRAETLPWLRHAIRGVAEGAETARRVAVGGNTGKNVGQNGYKNGSSDAADGRFSVRSAAERTVQVVAPLRRLAPHCTVVAEAHARASLCVGAFAEATRAADEDGFGARSTKPRRRLRRRRRRGGRRRSGRRGFEPGVVEDKQKNNHRRWPRRPRAGALREGNPGACVDELAGLSASLKKPKTFATGFDPATFTTRKRHPRRPATRRDIAGRS